MYDLSPALKGEKSVDEILAGVDNPKLRQITNETIDTLLNFIADCTDADVLFQPIDPNAHDPYAEDTAETDMAWTLGHLIVHVTASSEEAAALAAEMARGVDYHGRSRSELPWQTVKTIAECRHRLEESRRMCLASLEMWPDQPNLTLLGKPWSSAPDVNAIGRYIFGLAHAWSHYNQIQDVVKQAKGVAH